MADMSPRPSQQHVLSLFFPENEDRPRLVWVKVIPVEFADDDGSIIPYHPRGAQTSISQVKSYLGNAPALRGLDDDEFKRQSGQDIWISQEWHETNPRTGARSPRRQVHVVGLYDMSKVSTPKSLRSITEINCRNWRGPLMFQAIQDEDGLDEECGLISDVTLADFRLIIDCAMHSPPNNIVVPIEVNDSGDEDDESESDYDLNPFPSG